MAIKNELRTSNNGVLIKPNAPVYFEYEKVGAKAIKEDTKDNLVVTVNGVDYDGDTVAINYMSSVVSVANAKFNQALSQGLSASDAYNAVYKQTIGWKGSDNEVHTVQIESIVEALELAMGEVANIVGA
jgi:hypothetical protein